MQNKRLDVNLGIKKINKVLNMCSKLRWEIITFLTDQHLVLNREIVAKKESTTAMKSLNITAAVSYTLFYFFYFFKEPFLQER